MNVREEKQKPEGHSPKTRLDLNPSGKLFSRIVPWHVGLAITGLISRLFEPTQRLVEPYAKNGQAVADLGCGRGYYTLALAQLVGQEGKVYAVDLDKKNIQALRKKADKGGYHNIETRASSASDLSFVNDKAIDFILTNGLL